MKQVEYKRYAHRMVHHLLPHIHFGGSPAARLALLAILALLWLPGCASRDVGFCGQPLEKMKAEEKAIYKKYATPVGGPVPKTKAHFRASDGAEVPLAIWKPSGPMRGILVASPGMDMGCSEFQPLGIRLAEAGYGLWALDLRGQGHEQDLGARGTRAPWRRWVRDVEELVGQLRLRYPGTPIYLTAQSTGNCVSLLAAAQLPPGSVQGVLMHSVPFVYLYPSALGSFAGHCVLPFPLRYVRFSSALGLSHDDSSFSSDHAGLEEWLGSPLRVKMRGEFLSQCFALGAAARASLPQIQVPVLVQVGCQDSLADKTSQPQCAVQKLTQAMPHAKVTVRRHHSQGHLLLREPGAENVIANDVKWLRAQASSKKPL